MMHNNVDPGEIGKFNRLSQHWWDPRGAFRTLHEINPLRLDYIRSRCPLQGRKVADIGCGGGLLSEALARTGARVTAIDLAEDAIAAAQQHAREQRLDIDYRVQAAGDLAAEANGAFDMVSCMEMLEHVPEPAAIVAACARLCKPGGHVFFSTLNRNPKAFLFAIAGGEYLLNLLPRGTHEYARFIKPSELAAWARQNGLAIDDISGLHYNPLTRRHRLNKDPSVNYLMHLRKEEGF